MKAILIMDYRVKGTERNLGRYYSLYKDNENKDLIYWSKFKYHILEYAKENNIKIIN